MSYLEERGIVHRDLAARNVLGTYQSDLDSSLFYEWKHFVAFCVFLWAVSLPVIVSDSHTLSLWGKV